MISNIDDPRILPRIRKAEELRRSYIKVRHVLRPTNACLVTQLEVPTDNTPPKQATSWKHIINPAEVTNRIFN